MKGRVPRSAARVAETVLCVTVLLGVAGSHTLHAQRTVADERQLRDAAAELLSRRVTIDAARVPRRRIVDLAARSAGVLVQYQSEAFAAYSDLLTVHLKDVPLREALERALAGTTLHVVADGVTQLAIVDAATAAAMRDSVKTGTVTGRIADSANGRALRGATVSMRGTKRVTLTDERGQYTLRNVPAGDGVIEIKLLGYRNVVAPITVNGDERVTVNRSLAPVATVLAGMITTATGMQRRAEVASDVTVLNVDSIRRVAPITSVTDLLENRVPGLNVQHTTGTPGDPSRLRLRGTASINRSNNPIIIVDGVRRAYPDDNASVAQSAEVGVGNKGSARYTRPSPLDQIDPNAIETIEVFKGPSAASMYGSDAANGVIVITTKRGRAGALQWTGSADVGTSYIPGKYPTFSYLFGHPVTGVESALCTLYTGQCIPDSTLTFQALNDPRFSPFHAGLRSGVSAGVRGGSQSLQYSFDGSARNEDGVMRLPPAARKYYETFVGAPPFAWMEHPDGYRTWSARTGLTAQLSPNASLQVGNSLYNSDQHRSSLGASAIGSLIGTFVDTVELNHSPLLKAFTERATASTYTSGTDATFTWQLRPWLLVNTTAGIAKSTGTDKTFVPSGLPSEVMPIAGDTTGNYSIGMLNTITKTFNAGTTLMVPLGGERQLPVGIGTNYYKESAATQSITTSYLPAGVTDPTLFISDSTVSQQTSVVTSTFGWYVEPRLVLQSRLIITPGLRLDGGSATGSNAGFTRFPKIEVAYIAVDGSGSDRTGLRRVFSQLRLRGAYGAAGVQPGPADRLRLYTTSPIVIDGGNTSVGAVAINTFGNTTLRPERSNELETGFDADLFATRVTFGATYYDKLRKDAIVSVSLPPSVGGGNPDGVFVGLSSTAQIGTRLQNIGTVRNRGFDLFGSAVVLESERLGWSMNGALSRRTDRVLSLSPEASVQTSVRVGYPLGSQWARPLAGFGDANHDGIIEQGETFLADSAVYVGSDDPRFTATFGTQLTTFSRRVSLNMDFAYTNGQTQLNTLGLNQLATIALAPGSTLLQKAVYLATAVDPQGGNGSLRDPSSAYALYQTVNTLRLQSLSLNWNLPQRVAALARAQSASIAIQGSNLWIHTNYPGKDPNVNGYTARSGVGDFGQIPEPRTWSLRLSLGN